GDGTGLSAYDVKGYAAGLSLDTEQFNRCLDSNKYAEKIQNDMNLGIASGVQGTPAFVINGQLVVGAQPYSVFQTAIDAALAE
ncbi:MAG: DsbA family protein, partial [Candidatus Woesearchaeota archaeon]